MSLKPVSVLSCSLQRTEEDSECIFYYCRQFVSSTIGQK
uniref:Uncharacterized protein n=1 Tax=Rhizophora mucronata TaxID=61149 RepID=A0A2P2QSA8_RHIMU